jgi:hypothetical protein
VETPRNARADPERNTVAQRRTRAGQAAGDAARKDGVQADSEVSTLTLYLLRFGYFYIAVGFAILELPALLDPESLSRLDKVVLSMLGAMALLALLGLRYPLRMLPLLFFEFERSATNSGD